MYSKKIATVLVISSFIFSSCTSWRTEPSFYRTVQTNLQLESNHFAAVKVNENKVTPKDGSIPVQYQREITKTVRKVTHWKTKPITTLVFVLLSFGTYLPFSFIPVDIDTKTIPTNDFKNNEIKLEVTDEKGNTWSQEIVLQGEKSLTVSPNFR